MAYRCVAGSVVGFVQQVACNYLPHGYWFYVLGSIPEGKDRRGVDEKLIGKYGMDVSRQTRSRRKRRGEANVHYVRYGEQFILLATHGRQVFFEEEKDSIRDARKEPIRFGGYSVSCRKDGFANGDTRAGNKYRVRVQVCREVYRDWRGYFVERAAEYSAERLARELYGFPYEPYAPVRQQMLGILRVVNKVRSEQGLEKMDTSVLRYRRKVVKPFEPAPEQAPWARAANGGPGTEGLRSRAVPPVFVVKA